MFDGALDDGIYGLNYLASQPGAYYVELKATGTSNSGEPFERYLSTTFMWSLVSRSAQCNTVKACQGGPAAIITPCNCASDSRYSIAVYGGRTFPMGSSV